MRKRNVFTRAPGGLGAAHALRAPKSARVDPDSVGRARGQARARVRRGVRVSTS
jgi:hypothetical protein